MRVMESVGGMRWQCWLDQRVQTSWSASPAAKSAWPRARTNLSSSTWFDGTRSACAAMLSWLSLCKEVENECCQLRLATAARNALSSSSKRSAISLSTKSGCFFASYGPIGWVKRRHGLNSRPGKHAASSSIGNAFGLRRGGSFEMSFFSDHSHTPLMTKSTEDTSLPYWARSANWLRSCQAVGVQQLSHRNQKGPRGRRGLRENAPLSQYLCENRYSYSRPHLLVSSRSWPQTKSVRRVGICCVSLGSREYGKRVG